MAATSTFETFKLQRSGIVVRGSSAAGPFFNAHCRHEPCPPAEAASHLPLPKGEGWGEGEGNVRQPSGHEACRSALHLLLNLSDQGFVTAAVTHLLRVCYGSDLNFAPILPMCYGCYGSRGGKGGVNTSTSASGLLHREPLVSPSPGPTVHGIWRFPLHSPKTLFDLLVSFATLS
jgi:hypothetical protein